MSHHGSGSRRGRRSGSGSREGGRDASPEASRERTHESAFVGDMGPPSMPAHEDDETERHKKAASVSLGVLFMLGLVVTAAVVMKDPGPETELIMHQASITGDLFKYRAVMREIRIPPFYNYTTIEANIILSQRDYGPRAREIAIINMNDDFHILKVFKSPSIVPGQILGESHNSQFSDPQEFELPTPLNTYEAWLNVTGNGKIADFAPPVDLPRLGNGVREKEVKLRAHPFIKALYVRFRLIEGLEFSRNNENEHREKSGGGGGGGWRPPVYKRNTPSPGGPKARNDPVRNEAETTVIRKISQRRSNVTHRSSQRRSMVTFSSEEEVSDIE